MSQDVIFSVSEFVAVTNQTLDYAFGGGITVRGELANFRVSKGKWVYFDLKDEAASVRFFGTVFMLPGPLEDGMLLEVRGRPRLHPKYNFSVNIQSMRPVGEGSIQKAAKLLEAKFQAEGLFDPARKRILPYPPETIGLITSSESAAYADFQKVLAARWRGLDVQLGDVQVQGESAPAQLVRAVQYFNQLANPPKILVLIRGGGSADDLQAFSDEKVVRAVAASRIPTLVAIGHESDTSLAELAADQRASTPSNAAELLVPDRRDVLQNLQVQSIQLYDLVARSIVVARDGQKIAVESLNQNITNLLEKEKNYVESQRKIVNVLNPSAALDRGFALIRTKDGKLVRSRKDLKKNAIVSIEIRDGRATAAVQEIRSK
jgi:exodeoxyribonuclease VII large subunit